MQKLYRPQIEKRGIQKPRYQKEEEEKIELDNRYFNIPDGDKKTLDFMDYESRMKKGDLAARGSIKLFTPKYNYDYGAMANPIKQAAICSLQDCDDYEDGDAFENEWDNIFKLVPDSDSKKDECDGEKPEKNFFISNNTNNYYAFSAAS